MATFGKTDVGGSGSQDSANQKTFTKATLSENGTATKMYMYTAGAHSGYDTPMKCGIYNYNATTDNCTLVATTNETTVLDGVYDWYEFTFASGVPLSAGDYFIGGIGGDAFYWKYSGDASVTRYHVPDTYSDGLSDPFGVGGSSSSTRLVSVYVEYTPSAGVPIGAISMHQTGHIISKVTRG